MLGCFALFLYPINGAPPKIRNEKDPKGSRKMSTTQQEQTRAAAPQEYLLEMRGITKAFAGVQALKGVDFYVRPGTVHALMGENGAGKSTLMKCLFGIYHKDEGTIKLRGQEVNFQSPHEALLNGISMVHQELEQVPERSVMENVWLGRFPKKFGLIDTAKMVKDTEAVLATLGGEVKIDPRARLSSLTVSKRQMVDIAKAVSYNCDIIALDEPTSSLNEKEVDILMGIIDGLRRQGKGIIYISHKMEEIFRIADDITVMRDGALIKTMRAAETNVDEVIRLMVGRELTDRFPPKQGTIGKEILVVKDLNDLGHHIHDISFDLHEGEVLGIAGLLGAGRTELLETLFGARTRESGTVTLKGKEIRNKSTAEAIKNGFALCTEERRFNGIFPDLGLDFNTAIAGIGNYTNKVGWLSTKKMTEDTQKMIDAMHTKTPSTKTKIRHLSGGNQQKVILGRWLLLNPDVFLLLYAFGGVLEAGRTGSANSTMGADYAMDAIAACVVGGVSMKGGTGTLPGVVIGVIIFQIISYGLIYIGVSPDLQYVVKGLIIIVAVVLDNQKSLRKAA